MQHAQLDDSLSSHFQVWCCIEPGRSATLNYRFHHIPSMTAWALADRVQGTFSMQSVNASSCLMTSMSSLLVLLCSLDELPNEILFLF